MNKASGSDGIPSKLSQILKDDAVKVLHSTCQQIWKTQEWSHDWERSVFIAISKGKQCQRMFKLLDNCTHFTCYQDNAQNPSGQASAVREIVNFQMFKLDLEKAEEPEIKLPTSNGSQKKQGNTKKNMLH